MNVGFHDHREQCLVNSAAAFEQAWEKRSAAQFGDPQV
jgi:hypothetical protein